MDEKPLVNFEVDDGIGVITVDYPPVNALGPGVADGIIAALDKGEADPEVKAMVLIGAGRTFIAGADIRQFGKPRTVPTHRDVRRHLQRRALVGAPADTRVLAFRVFANDHPIEFRPLHVPQRRRDSRQNTCRPHVGVLIERLADCEAQTPKRDVIGDLGMARRSEQDRVVAADQVAAVLRHHAAVLLIVLAAPVEGLDVKTEAADALGEGMQNVDTCGDDLGSDAVSGDCRNLIGLHAVSLPLARTGYQLPFTPAALITASHRGTSAARCEPSAWGVACSVGTGTVPRLASRSITF